MSTFDHNDLGVYLADQDLAVDQSDLLVRIFLRDGEVSRLGNRESFRSALLNQAVSVTYDQTVDCMSLAIRSPGVDQIAFFILCQLIYCQFGSNDRIAQHVELVDYYTLILHGKRLVLSVIRDSELYGFRDCIAFRSGNFGQRIGLSNFQSGDRMGLIFGSPGINCLPSFLIGDSHLRAWYFLLPGHIGLGHGDLLVDHLHSLDSEAVINRKVDIRSADITFGRDLLMKGVAASDMKSGNGVRLFTGHPFVDFPARLLIGDSQGSTDHFLLSSHVSLGHEDLRVGQFK